MIFFITTFVDCHFNETVFSSLEGDKNKEYSIGTT